MNIRPATTKDLGQLETLFSLPELALPTKKYMSAELLSHYLDNNFFLVAEESDTIIGAIFGEKLKYDGMMLWDFAVSNDYQRKGVGKALLVQFEENTRNAGITWIIGYVPKNNPESIRFYQNKKYNIGETPYLEFLKSLEQ